MFGSCLKPVWTQQEWKQLRTHKAFWVLMHGSVFGRTEFNYYCLKMATLCSELWFKVIYNHFKTCKKKCSLSQWISAFSCFWHASRVSFVLKIFIGSDTRVTWKSDWMWQKKIDERINKVLAGLSMITRKVCARDIRSLKSHRSAQTN